MDLDSNPLDFAGFDLDLDLNFSCSAGFGFDLDLLKSKWDDLDLDSDLTKYLDGFEHTNPNPTIQYRSD